MEQAKIDRINALAKKAKSPEGLTPEVRENGNKIRIVFACNKFVI